MADNDWLPPTFTFPFGRGGWIPEGIPQPPHYGDVGHDGITGGGALIGVGIGSAAGMMIGKEAGTIIGGFGAALGRAVRALFGAPASAVCSGRPLEQSSAPLPEHGSVTGLAASSSPIQTPSGSN
jgi:hypothetical protein